MNKLYILLVIAVGLLVPVSSCCSAAMGDNASNFLNTARQTGVTIEEDSGVQIWHGPAAGRMKPAGPLRGKKICVLAASEFSDFQAYYLACYLSEFGSEVVFIPVDWVRWKFTRPNVKTKGVQGMFGMSLDPIGVMGEGARHNYKSMDDANPKDYDGLVIMGGHSADVMVSEQKVIDFIKAVHDNGGVIGSIGGGSIPLI